MRPALMQLFRPVPQPSFSAPLKTHLLLDRGVGIPTYTRASTATVTDFEGLLKTAKSGEARFEGARRVENLILNPETGTGWGTSIAGTGTTPIITLVPGAAPDGGTAIRIQASVGDNPTDADSSFIVMGLPLGVPLGLKSLWIKSNTGVSQTVQTQNASNLADQVLTASTTWQRQAKLSINAGFNIGVRGNKGSQNVDVLIYKPQYEIVTGQANQAPSEYVSNGVLSAPYHGANVDGVKYFPTTNGNTVVNNIVTEAPGVPLTTLKGYLSEGSRTNLLLQSAIPATQNITTTAQSYTISMWGTGTCTLSGTATGVLTGTGANDRVQLTVTATAGTLTLTFAGTNTNGQLEAGAFASSYIPTTTAAETRSADVLNYSAINNINSSALSLYADGLAPASSINNMLVSIDDGSTNNRIELRYSGGVNTGRVYIAKNSVQQASIVTSNFTPISPRKVAMSYSSSSKNVTVSYNNVSSSTIIPTFSAPEVVYIKIGYGTYSSSELYGNIRNVRIYPKILKDSKLVEMTR
jgi:hypothetical protein